MGEKTNVNDVLLLCPLGKSSFDAHFYYDFITHPFVPLTLLRLVFGFLYDVFFLFNSLISACSSFFPPFFSLSC